MKYTGQMPFHDYINMFLNAFSDNCSYAIWGYSEHRYKSIQKFCPSAHCIVDGNPRKQGMYLEGIRIESPEVLSNCDYKIIVAVQDYPEVFTKLQEYGFSETDYCNYQEYMLLKSYAMNKIYLPEVALYITGQCNLRCKACMMYVPYQKNPLTTSFEEITKSLQDLLHYVDFVGDIHIAGGEVFLDQNLISRLLDYISKTLSNRYSTCRVTTNGTIVPGDDCLSALKRSNSYVVISNYSSQIGEKSKVPELEYILKEWGIPYKIEGMFGRTEENKWFDFGDRVPLNKSPELLKEHFQLCTATCLDIYKSRLYNCVLVLGAAANLAYPQTSNDYFDLSVNPPSETDYLRFLKYCLGYCDEGYYNWCDCCNGYGVLLNKKTAIPGEQIKR